MTILLAQIWGPVLVALGLGMLMSRKYYMKMYRDLEREVLAMILFGVAFIALGILQIKAHNAWGSLPEKVVSLLGWGLLFKGMVLTIFPALVDRKGDWIAGSQLMWAANITLFILGGYLTWFSYFLS